MATPLDEPHAKQKSEMTKKPTVLSILDTSRELFNERGVESVSVAHIAGTLNISTGNLTYHYAKKKDIVDAHVDALEQGILGILENFPYGGTAPEYFNSQLELFKLTWEYRFLFNGTAYLIQRDLLDREHYRSLIDHVYLLVLQHCEQLIASKTMKPIPAPHDATTLVDCIWWQWLGWLETNQLLPQGERKGLDELLESGLRHMLFLIQPYMNEEFIQKVHAEFHDPDAS